VSDRCVLPTALMVCFLSTVLALPASAQLAGAGGEGPRFITLKERTDGIVRELLAAREHQNTADDIGKRIGEAASRNARAAEMEALAKQREAALADASSKRLNAIATLWPALVRLVEEDLANRLPGSIDDFLFPDAARFYGEVHAAIQRITLFNALPPRDLTALNEDLSALRRRMNIALMQKVGTNCPSASLWPGIEKWSEQGLSSPAPRTGQNQGSDPWGELKLRCVIRAIEPVCRDFQRAIVERNIKSIQWLFPEALAIQWQDFFDQFKYIDAVRPPQDFKANSGSSASCTVPVVISQRPLNPLGTTMTQSAYHVLSLAAEGDRWVITSVSRQMRAF
jgi:hypothetical protein